MNASGTLSVSTPTDREIVMTRTFDAPRHLVWDALTRPELVRRWLLGPPGWSMPVCEIDLRVGGAYRHVWRKDSGAEMGAGACGTEFGTGGVFREIVPGERLVATEIFDGQPGPGALNTSVLTERAGKTTLMLTMRLDSKETRDAVLKTGMAEGVGASYDRLDDVLASQSAGAKKQEVHR